MKDNKINDDVTKLKETLEDRWTPDASPTFDGAATFLEEEETEGDWDVTPYGEQK